MVMKYISQKAVYDNCDVGTWHGFCALVDKSVSFRNNTLISQNYLRVLIRNMVKKLRRN